jgi:hypothetical protein
MRVFFPLLTLVAAAMLLPAAATAEDATDDKPDRAKMRQRVIEEFDVDGDGKLNEEEQAKARAKQGGKDAKGARGGKGPKGGKDGAAGRGGRGPQGRAGRPEGALDPMKMFDRIDANKDGQLSREEFKKFSSMMQGRRGAGGPPNRGGAERGERRGPPRAGAERGERRGRQREGIDRDRKRFRPLQNPGPPSRRARQRSPRGREGARGREGQRSARDRRSPPGRGQQGARRGPPERRRYEGGPRFDRRRGPRTEDKGAQSTRSAEEDKTV